MNHKLSKLERRKCHHRGILVAKFCIVLETPQRLDNRVKLGSIRLDITLLVVTERQTLDKNGDFKKMSHIISE